MFAFECRVTRTLAFWEVGSYLSSCDWHTGGIFTGLINWSWTKVFIRDFTTIKSRKDADRCLLWASESQFLYFTCMSCMVLQDFLKVAWRNVRDKQWSKYCIIPKGFCVGWRASNFILASPPNSYCVSLTESQQLVI